MMMMKQIVMYVCLGLFLSPIVHADSRSDVLKELNSSPSTIGSSDVKSWELFFDACIKTTPTPRQLSKTFNMNTVWPDMKGWTEISMWAAQNEHMEKAFLDAGKRALVGLPYGRENVPDIYREHGIVADIGVDDQLHSVDFGYIDAVRIACLWATVETYRLFESGEADRAVQLMMSELILLRKFCDREFLKEQLKFMPMLGDALSNTRDMFYAYRESLTATQFRSIAKDVISPLIRTDPMRLSMPEGDRVVGKALLNELFQSNGDPDTGRFREVLSDIQAYQEPLTRFGAARYWEEIAEIHRGRDDSIKRLDLIYDDWWRRWKMRAFHEDLDSDSALKRCNPVRYAAVTLIIRDIQDLFDKRDLLTAQVNGTAVSAALCGYKNHYGVYPSGIKMMYAQLLHRSSNLDPMRSLKFSQPPNGNIRIDWTTYPASVGPFHYRKIDKSTKVNTNLGSVRIEEGECLLYSVDIDDEDNRGTDSRKDIILWPPLKSLERKAGLLD